MSKRNDRPAPPSTLPSPPSQAPSPPPGAPRIYVACLASYNAGHLHGAWMEVEPDEMTITCHACEAEATGLCDRSHDKERGLVPACERHVSHELAGASLEGGRALRARIQMEVLSTSPVEGAESFAIHDTEGWHGLHVGEYDAPDDVVAKARLVVEHGALGVAVAKHLGADHDPDLLHQVWAWMEEQYEGAFDSPQDWAGTWLEETGQLDEVPKALRPYVDFERLARDAELGGDVVMLVLEGESADGRVHVFRNA